MKWRVTYTDRSGKPRRAVTVEHPGPAGAVAMNCVRRWEWADVPALHGAGSMYGRSGVAHSSGDGYLSMTDGLESATIREVRA